MKLSEKHEWDLGCIGVLEDVQDFENEVTQLEEENDVLRNTISLLKNENERLTKLLEEQDNDDEE